MVTSTAVTPQGVVTQQNIMQDERSLTCAKTFWDDASCGKSCAKWTFQRCKSPLRNTGLSCCGLLQLSGILCALQ